MRAMLREDAAAQARGEGLAHQRRVPRHPWWRANLEQELDGRRGARSVVAAVVVLVLLGLAVAGDPATSNRASAVEGVAAAAVDAKRD